MCCCGKAVINGEPGYSWDGKTFSTRKPYFAEMEEGDEFIRDLPGRCGGVDSHSHDLRIVKQYSSVYLLVHHGGGSERIRLPIYGQQRELLKTLDDNALYWMMLAVESAHRDARSNATDAEALRWRKAAAEKRIRTRRQRGTDFVKVWIEGEGFARV